MQLLTDVVRAAIPRRARRFLRQVQRRHVLVRAMDTLARLPPGAHLSLPVADDLVHGWANEQMSGNREFLQAVFQCAWETDGPVLECGSGLTSLLLGLAARRTGHRVFSLEHDPFWAATTRAALARFELDTVEVCNAPLRNYGDFSWYDPPRDVLPAHFSLVVCDGPPGTTPGGRYGLIPVLGSRLKPGSVILLDDATRAGEQIVLARWGSELNAAHEVFGSEKPFAQLSIPA